MGTQKSFRRYCGSRLRPGGALSVMAAAALVCAAPVSAADREPVSIAVYPMKAAGVPDSLALALGPLLSQELQRSRHIIVIKEDMLEAVVERIGMSQSGLYDDSAWRLEVGRLMNSQKFVTSTVSQLGATYIVTLDVTDVQTGRVEYSDRERCSCRVDALEHSIANIAARAVAHLTTPPDGAAPVAAFAPAARPVRPPAPAPAPPLKERPAQDAPPAPTVRMSSEKEDMVYVPAGEFMMGCDEARDKVCNSDEYPYHSVYLDAFWIDRTEVTNTEYTECVATGRCARNAYFDSFQEPEAPVVGVSWSQAATYCAWNDTRLPTEAEWEKAARGTDGRIYPWGEDWDGMLVNSQGTKDGFRYTAPVGSFPQGASPYGALDMAGNVWEWVADVYEKEYYEHSPGENPRGPETGSGLLLQPGAARIIAPGKKHILRGGAWSHAPRSRRASNRLSMSPDVQSKKFGFRCAADTP